jgi:hypothetical protein
VWFVLRYADSDCPFEIFKLFLIPLHIYVYVYKWDTCHCSYNSMFRSRYLILRSLRNSEPTSNNLFKITTVISGNDFEQSFQNHNCNFRKGICKVNRIAKSQLGRQNLIKALKSYHFKDVNINIDYTIYKLYMGDSRKISNESYNITFLNYRTL